jgi:UDP-N-acetylmuramoyl-tripeptide--D-alanyl-D-alanine ligase
MKRVSLTLEDLFNIPSGKIYNTDALKPVYAVTIDSRHVPSNALFIAIKGDRLDGHDFIHDALTNGASVMLVNESRFQKLKDTDVPVITVKDTVSAFGYLASVWRQKLNTKVIGITGSTGKTTVKEYTAVLLNEKYKVNKTLANNNNHIGVPLTIFSTTNSHEYLVLEMGTNHFGEIKYTAGIAKPDIALITNIGSSHLEFLKNKKGVQKEKTALFDETVSAGGTVIKNKDDKYLSNSFNDYKKRFTYSLSSSADLKGKIKSYTEDGRPLLELEFKNKKYSIELPVYGDHAARNFISAAAIAVKAGLSGSEIVKGAKKIKNYSKRFNLKRLKTTVLIDDTYNANPDSMREAVITLKNMYPDKKKIAVLGDMLELGTESQKLHTGIAKVLKQNKISAVYTIGSMSEHIYEFLKNTRIEARHFISRASLKRFLGRQKFEDSVVLVKGSRGMRMEEFVNIIEDHIS